MASQNSDPVVVDIRDVVRPGQPLPPDVVYIGRRVGGVWNLEASIWANPHKVRDHGAEQAVRLYWRDLYRRFMDDPALLVQLRHLADKRLACWCRDNPAGCHGHVIADFWRTFYGHQKGGDTDGGIRG